MTTKKYQEPYPEDYDEYIASTPLEARFDPATIQIAVTEAFPKHDLISYLGIGGL